MSIQCKPDRNHWRIGCGSWVGDCRPLLYDNCNYFSTYTSVYMEEIECSLQSKIYSFIIKRVTENIILWRWFTISDPRELVRVQNIMNKYLYLSIHKYIYIYIKHSARKLSLENHCVRSLIYPARTAIKFLDNRKIKASVNPRGIMCLISLKLRV